MKHIKYVAVLAAALLGAMETAQARPQVVGRWETRPELMPINPVHAVQLRTGKVLVIAGSGNNIKETVYRAAIWDPVAGTIAVQVIPWDVFCNGMSALRDGRMFITGGTTHYSPYYGARYTVLFDPIAGTFSRVQDMKHGRWYPTNIALPDGRTATFSGQNDTDGAINPTDEIYTVGSGWSPERPMNWPSPPPNYPRAHLTPAGDLFFSGPQRQSHRFNPATLQWRYNVASTRYSSSRRYGSSVLLGLRPPDYVARILIAGGGVSASGATNTAEIIDLSRATPQWNGTGALTYARVEHNAVLLPNGKVLAVGGSAVNNVSDANGGGSFSEMYNPETGNWTVMAPQLYWHLYHSVALLLPDARVVSMGNNTQGGGVYTKQIEVFSPPYLFNSSGGLGPRPSLTGVPAQIGYAAAFNVTTPAPGAIQEAVLIRPGTPTHAFDMDQRLVGLEKQGQSGTQLQLRAPPNRNIAPPGYYMLFLINAAGVPSVAKFVRLS